MAVALFALALGASACGGDGEGPGSGADIAPASSAVFVALITRFDGDQWQAAERIATRFPAGRDALRHLLGELQAEDVDLERDVKPALGPEVDLVILDTEAGDEGVLLTQPRDPARFRDLVRKSGGRAVTEEVDGWWVAAPTREALSRFKKAREGDSLAESDRFAEAMDGLPSDALARVYVNGEGLRAAAGSEPEVPRDAVRLLACVGGGEKASSLAFALAAEADGIRIEGTIRGGGLDGSKGRSGETADRLRGGAVAYVAVDGLGERLRKALRCAAEADEDFSRQLAQAELALGVSLEEDLLPLFERETAIAVYPGPAPRVALVTQVDDEAHAFETVDRIAERASAFLEQVTVEDVRLEEIADVRVRRITIGGERELHYAAAAGTLVLASSEAAILAALMPGEALSDDPAFARAREAANAPDRPAGVAYVNFAEAVDALMGVRTPSRVRANLEPLRTLFLWGEAGDDALDFEGLLEID